MFGEYILYFGPWSQFRPFGKDSVERFHRNYNSTSSENALTRPKFEKALNLEVHHESSPLSHVSVSHSFGGGKRRKRGVEN